MDTIICAPDGGTACRHQVTKQNITQLVQLNGIDDCEIENCAQYPTFYAIV
jgi:hypothetical protein